MFAIIKAQGKQYLVSKGDVITVAHLQNAKKEGLITLENVLVYADQKRQEIGQPYVGGAQVTAKVITPAQKGDKVEIIKFKAKKRYTKKTGFRPTLTVLKIEDIVCK